MFAQVLRATALVRLLARPALAEQAPLSVDGATTISVDEAAALFDQGVPLIDVRTAWVAECGQN